MTAEKRNESDGQAAETPNGAPDVAHAMAAFWSQWMEQSSRGTQALLEAFQSAGDPAKFQSRMMEGLAEQIDSFMRTPPFLEAMRRNLKAVTDMKVMQDQVVEGAARQLGLPLADDITGLFERLNSVNRKLLSRLDAIEERLAAIEAAVAGAPKRRSSKPSA
jgi:hypothetical protein